VRRLALSLGLALHLVAHPRRYGVVHLHGTPYLLVVLRLLKSLLGFSLVYKPTSVGKDDAPIILDRYGRRILDAVDRWIAIADPIAESALEKGVDAVRIVHLSNGVDLKRFRPLEELARAAVREELAIHRDHRLWITVGPIVRGKRLDLLIETWSRLAVDDEILIVVGPTEYEGGSGAVRHAQNGYRTELDRLLVTRGLAERVRFLGARKDVERLLGAADAFVFASAQEGMPNAVLEALAAGLPVVATPIGAAANLRRVGDGRITFAEPTPEALADAVRSLATRPGLVPNGLVQTHDLAGVARRYRQLYTQLRLTGPQRQPTV
jgi:glycosyltransferase involved in cell wall biosynthesis